MEGERQKNGPGDGPKNWPDPFPLYLREKPRIKSIVIMDGSVRGVPGNWLFLPRRSNDPLF
jgi:hypothetical protein